MSLDWRRAISPSLAEFEDIAHQAFEALPKRFRDLCDGVIIRIEDFLAALAAMPEASGVAFGFDRLVMLATGATRIEQVLWTPVAGQGTTG